MTVWLAACGHGQPAIAAATKPFAIAIFVPGFVQGSPTYELLVAGVNQAISKTAAPGGPIASIKLVEGGGKQSQWPVLLAALASSARYDVIVTANPSMPLYCAQVAQQFSRQKFLVLDGFLAHNSAIATIGFNHYQEAWLDGYFAALIGDSGLPGTKSGARIGLIAAQEYPVMLNEIKPGFLAGARAIDPRIQLDFRVLGDWNDAAKANAIARDMIANQVDVILTIAGGGNQGVVKAARDTGTYVVWYDTSGYEQGPGVVIGSSLTRLDQAAETAVTQAITGNLAYGTAQILGIREGGVGFDTVAPLFQTAVPQSAQVAQRAMIQQLVSGERIIPIQATMP